ncbi:hypothetical protein PV721_17825 [Streptomyces sp. MB09-01]|uniref:hypothetical protein n=1 Tax=Streptomyces sp. MB09-01 TaxID=3028666 RepID=UPI0029AB3E4C|nr:hypothetical protein [Streptomyces sp. MB09-01]MDX3536197.1 hypothetical protein [Streptomyces sp. MB09-01]
MAVLKLSPREKLSLALGAQNFRPVNLDALTRPAEINFASVPSDLVAALEGVRRATTNWDGIGHQLALLRDGLNTDGRFLLDVHIGAKSQALKVVVTCGFGGPPLSEPEFARRIRFTWTIMRSLEAHIQQFEIQPQLLAILEAARSKYLSFTDPVTKAAVDLAWAMVSTSSASGGPLAVYIAACFAGVSPELGRTLRTGGLNFEEMGFGNQPSLEGLAWDCSRPNFADDSLYFGVLEHIDDQSLKDTLAL